MNEPVRHVTLLPTYQVIPACSHAVSGDCAGGNCPCANYSPPEGLPGEGLPQAAIDAFWEALAARCPPVVLAPAPHPAELRGQIAGRA